MTSNADKIVLPVPVAEITNDLFSPQSLKVFKLASASTCIELGLTSIDKVDIDSLGVSAFFKLYLYSYSLIYSSVQETALSNT